MSHPIYQHPFHKWDGPIEDATAKALADTRMMKKIDKAYKALVAIHLAGGLTAEQARKGIIGDASNPRVCEQTLTGFLIAIVYWSHDAGKSFPKPRLAMMEARRQLRIIKEERLAETARSTQ